WPSSRRSSSSRASEVFSEHLAERRHVHHRLRQKLLQLRVLLLQRLQPLGLRHLHAAILLAPCVERRIGDAVLAAQLRRRQSRLMLFQDADDLLFREPGSFHYPSPLSGNRLTSKRGLSRGAGQGFYHSPHLRGEVAGSSRDSAWKLLRSR